MDKWRSIDRIDGCTPPGEFHTDAYILIQYKVTTVQNISRQTRDKKAPTVVLKASWGSRGSAPAKGVWLLSGGRMGAETGDWDWNRKSAPRESESKEGSAHE